jgi:AcrR family transcriptional regulator
MSKTTRITKDPETRRQEILDKAGELFEAQGIAKTSMSDIADKVGVAKGLVYYYFASKEELIEAIVEQFIGKLANTLDDIVQQDALDFYGKLNAILNLYFHFIEKHPAILVLSPANPGVFELIRDRLSSIALNHALSLLQQGLNQEQIRIRYPEYMLKILIRGLGDLYIEGVHELAIHATLIEQTLGLEPGQLKLT